jgi:hypothetical protein
MATRIKLDRFTQAYVECALWSSTDDDGEPLDWRFSVEDIAPDTLAKMVEDCAAFQNDNAELLAQAYERYPNREWSVEEQAGHDFWLTRNRHGAGFWDRGLGLIGGRLTDAAHAAGGVDLFVGDDGKICA